MTRALPEEGVGPGPLLQQVGEVLATHGRLVLRDDGAQPDSAIDGTYSLRLSSITVAGTYVFTFTVEPGRTVALMTFVVKGLSEVYDPRGGFPIPLRDGLVAPKSQAPFSQGTPVVPPAGSQIAQVTAVARQLVAEPDLRGLTPRQQAQIVNWQLPAATTLPSFTVVEKSVPQLADALARGITTSEDIVREYLTRLSTYDRNGVALRSMLALNPHVVSDARALDAERANGRVRGAFHGIPVAFKDNIDVLGLPTTGGSRALIDHLRPLLAGLIKLTLVQQIACLHDGLNGIAKVMRKGAQIFADFLRYLDVCFHRSCWHRLHLCRL